MQGWLGTEGSGKVVGVHGGDGRGIEGADTSLQFQRPPEGLLHRHLLVERKTDEQGQGFPRQKSIGLRITRVGKLAGRHSSHGLQGTPTFVREHDGDDALHLTSIPEPRAVEHHSYQCAPAVASPDDHRSPPGCVERYQRDG